MSTFDRTTGHETMESSRRSLSVSRYQDSDPATLPGMKPRAFIAVIGLVLLAAGLFFGIKSASIPYSNGSTESCGSAYSPREIVPHDFGEVFGNAPVSPLTPEQRCADALSSNRTISFVLLGAGVLVLIGAAVVRTERRAEQTA